MARRRLTGSRLQARNRRILQRDHGTCQLCGQPVDTTVHWTHPNAPQVDHIIPIRHGGPDTDNNLALTHRRCNRAKSDRIDHTPSRHW